MTNGSPQRKSLRYKGYDYATAGAYFVTICVQQGRSLLGTVHEGVLIPSEAGMAVIPCWHTLPERFPSITLDEFCVMPNHVHGIVWLQNAVPALLAAPVDDIKGAASSAPTNTEDALTQERPTLGQVMRTFKSKSAIAANGVLHRSGRFWLRNYWDRIIRDDRELENIRNYIRTNPQRWHQDQLHPDAPPNKWNQTWGDADG